MGDRPRLDAYGDQPAETAVIAAATCSLLLVRHPQVDQRYRGVCYGQSDIELSDEGRAGWAALAVELAALNPLMIVHSGMIRTRLPAECVARHCSAPVRACPEIRERHFGDWEMRTWDDIHQANPGDLDRLTSEPDSFRPPGGETTYQLRDRVVAWFHKHIAKDAGPGVPTKWHSLAAADGDQLPGGNKSACRGELVVAIAHGGPIAALLGHLEQLPAERWASKIPSTGAGVWIDPTTRTATPFAGQQGS